MPVSLHLRSRFGRRLFSRFLIAALLPMAVLATFSYSEMREQLMDQLQHGLRDDSKSLGMELINELSLRVDLLKESGAREIAGGASGFVWVRDERDPQVPALDADEARGLAAHGATVRLYGAHAPLFVVRRSTDNRILYGRLDPAALWQRHSVDTPYCILDKQQRPILCTQGLQLPVLDLSSRDRSLITASSNGVPHLAGHWSAHLDGLYGAGVFHVVTTVPAQSLTLPLAHLRYGFIAIFALALGLIVAMAASQIGRQTEPLDALTRGVRRLARGEMDTRVDVPGDDEFALLGATFNTMSDRLKRKFNMLRLLAELDRAVLGSGEPARVNEAILSGVLDAIPCDAAGIALIDANGSATYARARSVDGHLSPRLGVSADALTQICSLGVDEWNDVQIDVESLLSGQPQQPGRGALVFSVRSHGRLDGLLVLALAIDGRQDKEEIITAGRNLADRMSVAGSSFAWEEKLYRQSHYDALTSLPNRTLLRDRVTHALTRASREKTSVAALRIDFDDFNSINEALGQTAGDLFLIEASRRLESLMRPEDTVARLAGDEFVMLVTAMDDAERILVLHDIAERIHQLLASPVRLADRYVISQASIGISLYPDNSNDFESLMSTAEVALHEAKKSSRGGFNFYSQSMNAAVSERFELAQELRRAVHNDELLLHFQPKVSAHDGAIMGAEALIRWQSPSRGLVSPGAFLPLIEDIGLNSWLTDFVLDKACAQMAAWDKAGLQPIPVSINVSPADLGTADFFDKITAALQRHDLSSSRLELEILETSEVGAGGTVRTTLQRLRDVGVKIALDDFGTGYSSLVYLTEMPADTLKLDRAFIRNLAGDMRQQAIVRQVISLARSLGFIIVAEGVEQVAQRDLLVDMECDLIQGFLYSRPLPPDELAAKLLAKLPFAA
ncbi:diguanylate cyclase domain protein [Methyloversatilis sp. RAC08]|uniref:putative bifunctional diguanylate cyclase/phosphodiesterase n=1 Tax=Methyloversatilis sp. RAC08 TaxID=1842540 RepID=UPI00083D97ED|nr:EAL domain-containing protein [Methyloversatilis sp. RAC08]AOF80862.1 diguanylate cyclase domain protein [Methyloversatilis sp. RAC08]